MASLPYFEDLGEGIYCIDTGFVRPKLAACYLLIDGDQAAFVDTGTANTVPSLLALLDHLGVDREQVRYVIPTHVHLDHAGGSGQLMAALRKAKLVVHPKGATHMIDPAKLTAGATTVYGEEVFQRDFGALEPIPETRVIKAEDGQAFDLGGRSLIFLDTPGHANHHGCIWDERSGGFFTGDTFGIAYPELRTGEPGWLFAPTTPVAFDPQNWHASVERLMDYGPRQMYLTHFGSIGVTRGLADRLHRSIDSLAALATGMADRGSDRPEALKNGVARLLCHEAKADGVDLDDAEILDLLAGDIDLNAQGLEVWLVRQERARNR